MHRTFLAASLLLGTLIAGLCVAGSESTQSSKGEPISVQLASGGSVDGFGPVTEKDGTLVFRLAGGQTVSLPLASVARVVKAPRPRAANDAQTPRKTRAPQPTSANAPVRYTNADLPESAPTDLPPLPEENSGTMTVVDETASANKPPQPQGQAPIPALTIGYAGLKDHKGHDEAWWRQRVSALKAEIERMQEMVVELTQAAGVANAQAVGTVGRGGLTGGWVSAQKWQTSRGARADLEEARSLLGALEDELASLPDEARRAGALPGWVRD